MTADRNVVHVTVDSLRVDHCGFLTGEKLTPSLDGVVYENAYATAGSTMSSAGSFLTGRYPHDRPTAETQLDTSRQHYRSEETIPERLSRAGYETAVFTANPHVSRYYLDGDTFDHFDDRLETTANQGQSSRGMQTNALSRVRNWWRGQEMFMTWEALYDDVVSWIETASEPYYCWVFLVDPHMPYLPPEGYRSHPQALNYLANAALFADAPGPTKRLLRDAYADTVRYTDDFFASLRGVTGDAALVVHADHGEAFGEGSAYGHGATHEEILHVPLVVSDGPSGRVSEPVSLRSLPAIVADLAGDDFEPTAYTEPYVRARLRGPERVLRGRSWKYVRRGDGDAVYELSDGDAEAVTAPELATLCRTIVDGWREENEERQAVMAATADVASEARL
jgi:arylsulfatase